ncbi:NADP-dependent oxidoreductase domain-containing protein [Pavlovales sp. CCMP2436]|nr:NADP-dependent oxidoreductase domain-containing protein [Pavlovales sp. CCMP2436]|mmetsp:Transcript_51094/g.120092  ORF Transcript_51094/g.120092 Transcript_51094/m.120092 type:complete len:313 (-) Transcript_51094:58-996(-)
MGSTGDAAAGRVPSLTLGAAGARIPALGFGVGTAWYGSGPDPKLVLAIISALDAGFRHIDDAETYANMLATGEAIRTWLARNPAASRHDLFVTNKVSQSTCAPGGIVAACSRSLAETGLDYFDAYLMHGPAEFSGRPFPTSLAQLWREMEEVQQLGLARSIGVSNFRISDLAALEADGPLKVPVVINQIEAHPLLQQPQLEAYCAERHILIIGYASLAPLVHPPAGGLGNLGEALARVAAAHGRTPAQVLLRWAAQQGRGLVSTSSKPERLAAFMSIFEFELSTAEVFELSEAGAGLPPMRHFWKALEPDAA